MSYTAQGLRLVSAMEAVTLSAVAGYVDAIGYLQLGGIYVANMSGNSVSIGIHAARTEWDAMWQKLLPVCCYVLALILTRLTVHIGSRQGVKRIASVALTAEIALLVLFTFVSGRAAGVVLASLAMGIQAGTVTRFNHVTIFTAFVTGSLVKFADYLSAWIISAASGPVERKQSKSFERAAWLLSVWLAYISGAFAGTLRFSSQGTPAVLWGCGGLACMVALDVCCPREFESET
jgi:uncharacterized membrane protein YoaK (UPF0700 family)